ncbi:MAG TPA: hypothetical protein VK656_07565 [Candidatus Acidoferrum sp.]|nr:hypothetical protein [Candidatus Acidoferrum sp.]
MVNKAKNDDGFAHAKASGEDDVEGHGMHQREGFARPKADGEGFAHAKATEGFAHAKAAGEEDDVEGHGFNIKSPSSRGE